MATITKLNARKLPDPGFGGVPYGNTVTLPYKFETNASGVMADSNHASAVGNGDKVILGVIPGGTQLADAEVIISDAFTASTTADIGFEYVDGVDDADVPQDSDYFFDGLDTASAARTRCSQALAPVVLPKDAYLILTVGGAAHASKGVADVLLSGIMIGVR